MFWFSLQLLSETFLTLRIIQRDIIINVHRSWRKVPLSDFLVGFLKNTQISNFMEISPVNAALFHARGQTDGRTHDASYSRFRNFANAPKNAWMHPAAKCAVSDLPATNLQMLGAALLSALWSPKCGAAVNMVTVPEARNGYTELHWCIWHLHRASDAIISGRLRFCLIGCFSLCPSYSVCQFSTYSCLHFIQFATCFPRLSRNIRVLLKIWS